MNRRTCLLCLIFCLTVFYFPGNAVSISKRPIYQISHSNLLIEDIYVQLSRHWSDRRATKALLDIIFIPNIISPSKSSEVRWHAYQNKLIDHIDLQQRGVFDSLNTDTSIKRPWKKFAGFLFPPTKSWVIRPRLSFRSGDLLDEKQLKSDLEDLKKLPYIKQAQLYVSTQNNSKVDILLTTQDRLPIKLGINAQKKQLELRHSNVAGWGHTWSHYFSYDQRLGYGFTYQAPIHIAYNLISELNYLHTRKIRLKRLAISRNLKQNSPYLGLGEISYQGRLEHKFLDGQATAVATEYQFYYQNLWLGKAWPAQNIDLTGKFYTVARIENQNFKDRPSVGPLYNRFFHNYVFILGSWGFAQQQKQDEAFVYDVGKKENIPTGFKYNFIGGYQVGEFWNRPYAGLNLAQAQFIPAFGYITSSINLGGFLRHSNIEQKIIKLSASYFTPLLPSKQGIVRHFIKINYLAGFNMFTAERLSTRTKRVVKAWTDPFPPGTQRLNLHLETVCWPRRLIAGCQIAILGFADIVILYDAQFISHQSTFCEAIGMGLRVGHERFSFGTIQANLSYKPTLRKIDFNIGMPINLSNKDLIIREPSTIEYR
jgi:hypothetical protein